MCSKGNGAQSTDIIYPLDFVPYPLPGMPEQIIFAQMPGTPVFIPPSVYCPWPSCTCTFPSDQKNGNGKQNGRGGNQNGGRAGNRGSNGKRDGLDH